MAKVKVKQIRSTIGCPGDQRGTVRALGLGKIGREAEHEDSPSLRGMIRKVGHLVVVEDGGSS